MGLFQVAGYDTALFEKSGPGKVLRFIWSVSVVVVTLVATVVSAAAGMQQVGWWEPFLKQLNSWRP
jgi:hypothetical protein